MEKLNLSKKRKSGEGGAPSIATDRDSKAKRPPNQESMGDPLVDLDIGDVADAAAKSSEPPESSQAKESKKRKSVGTD